MSNRTQRVRDPVHGLIVFREDRPLDQLAWKLLDTPAFQRLRRIRQLGVSEFVFPNATHTRFAHSIGVFHTARALVEIIRREVGGTKFVERRADVAVIAALLHDLGHGPFSHTFEGVQKSRKVTKHHEQWTADIIRSNEGGIRELLDGYDSDGTFADEVAVLIESEDPADIYHAVVSSSFDADRLDYLRRDRLMTGTGAGAIDFDWLMEHVRVRDVAIEAVDELGSPDASSPRVPTFCFEAKAQPAAEQFLLARYTLHEQVYFHKTTRCVEQMVGKLLRRVATLAESPEVRESTGLPDDHPLIRFFSPGGATLRNYLSLDDLAVMGALPAMECATDAIISDLASGLRNRRLYKTLDVREFGHEEGVQRYRARRIDKAFEADLKAETVIKDEGASINIYTQIGGDEDKTHKKLHILDARGPREITQMSTLIGALATKRQFTRYYFADASDRERARKTR